MTTQSRPRSLTPVIGIFLICLAPVVFAVLAYYFPSLGLRSTVRTHYGTLIEPQRPIPDGLVLHDEEGRAVDLNTLKGKWLLISAGPGACPQDCVEKLFVLRNSHASQGRNVDRVLRLWLVTDDAPISPIRDKAYRGTQAFRVEPDAVEDWLVPDAADRDAALLQRMWIVDPLGHLMMSFPDTENPEGVRDDIRQLLKNSRVG